MMSISVATLLQRNIHQTQFIDGKIHSNMHWPCQQDLFFLNVGGFWNFHMELPQM